MADLGPPQPGLWLLLSVFGEQGVVIAQALTLARLALLFPSGCLARFVNIFLFPRMEAAKQKTRAVCGN